MTNDATRANAQVLPDRRRFLINTGAAAAGLAASVAIPADTQAGENDELDRLIAAYERATGHFEAVCEKADIDTPKREIFVPLSIGGAQSTHADDDLFHTQAYLRKEIGARYAKAENALMSLRNLPGDLEGQARAAMRKGHADDLRTMRRLINEEDERREATGFNAVKRAWSEACDAETEALHALLDHPCTSLEAVQRKAACLLSDMDNTGRWLEEEQIRMLLTSLTGGEA